MGFMKATENIMRHGSML